jgi:hypothetical protein
VFLSDLLGVLAIKGESLKSFFHNGALILTPIVFFVNLALKTKKLQFALVCLTCILTISTFSYVIYRKGVLGYLFSTSSWNTQTIVYQNIDSKNKKIEFQMRDIGARGYNKRHVKVTYLTPWFMLTTEVDPEQDFGKSWKKVDKDVNELGIVW